MLHTWIDVPKSNLLLYVTNKKQYKYFESIEVLSKPEKYSPVPHILDMHVLVDKLAHS